MVLGYIGFGEAAFEMSTGLRGEGLKDIVAFDNMIEHPVFGPQIKNRAGLSAVKLLPSPAEVIAASDLVMVAVPASVTLHTCETIAEYFRPEQLYVDLTAASPAVKKAAALLADRRCTVGEAAKSVGYEDAFVFSRMYKKRYGLPPSATLAAGALPGAEEDEEPVNESDPPTHG